MFTTCLFVIVTSITTDATSNKQSNDTGTNNYPLFNRRILNFFIFLSIIFRIINLVIVKIDLLNPSILNLRAVYASETYRAQPLTFTPDLLIPIPEKSSQISHPGISMSCAPAWRRSGRRRSRRLPARFGRGLDRSGVRIRASWPDRTRGVAESAPRRAAPG